MDSHPSEGVAKFLGTLVVAIVGFVMAFRIVKMAVAIEKALIELFSRKRKEE